MAIKLYIIVFAILVGVTSGELALIGYPGLDRALTVTTLIALAGVKALLVAMFFQHLRDEPKHLTTVLLTGLLLAIALMSVSFLQLHT